MATYTTNLNLEKPLQTEYYNIDKHNANYDKIDTAVKNNTDDIAELDTKKLDKTGGTVSGALTVSGGITGNWFKSLGNTGWLNQTYGGGWYMTDSDWLRSYADKGICTGWRMKADSGFYGDLHGIADNATNAEKIGNDDTYMRFHWKGQGGQPTWLWGSNDSANAHIWNPSNFSVAHASKADTATDAKTVNGWNVDSFKRNLGGRNQPTLTSILDGCYDINGNKINNANNASTGISGYGTGNIHLTQSYKNFDKILVVLANDETNFGKYTLWDTWELAYAFSHGEWFSIANDVSDWIVWTAVKAGTQTRPLSTETIWYTQWEHCVLVDIIGVNY